MTFHHQTTSGTNPDDRRRGCLDAHGLSLLREAPRGTKSGSLKEPLRRAGFNFPGVPHPEGPVPHSEPLPQHPDHHDDSPVVAAAMFDGAFTW